MFINRRGLGIVNRLAKTNFKQYHSYYHVNPVIIDATTVENKLLERALTEHVPEVGFKPVALEKAAHDLELNPNTLGSLFGGDSVYQLVLYHLKKSRQSLIPLRENLGEYDSELARLKYLVKQRLAFNEPIAQYLDQVIANLSFPTNVSSSMQELHNLSDDISFYAGDKSNDFAWYSKRMALSGVYVQSEIFMSKDKTPGFQETMKFVDDRLNEVDKAGYAYNCVEEWVQFNAWSSLNAFKSIVMRG